MLRIRIPCFSHFALCSVEEMVCLISRQHVIRTATEVRNKEKRSENHEIVLEQVLSIVSSIIKIIIVRYAYIIVIYDLILLLSKLPIAIVDILMYVIREFAIEGWLKIIFVCCNRENGWHQSN